MTEILCDLLCESNARMLSEEPFQSLVLLSYLFQKFVRKMAVRVFILLVLVGIASQVALADSDKDQSLEDSLSHGYDGYIKTYGNPNYKQEPVLSASKYRSFPIFFLL